MISRIVRHSVCDVVFKIIVIKCRAGVSSGAFLCTCFVLYLLADRVIIYHYDYVLQREDE